MVVTLYCSKKNNQISNRLSNISLKLKNIVYNLLDS